MSRIVVLSDVALGYGSPQAIRIAVSLGHIYGTRPTILAPLGDGAASIIAQEKNLDLIEIETGEGLSSQSGQTAYSMLVGQELARLKPEVLVLCAFLAAPALAYIKSKPKVTIFYAYEHTDDANVWQAQWIQAFSDRFDLVIYPEESRAALDAPKLSIDRVPALILYNGSDLNLPIVAPGKRSGRVVYTGSLDQSRTGSAAMFDAADHLLPIDAFGQLDIPLTAEQQANPYLNYMGRVPANLAFYTHIANASASISLWLPKSQSTLFACPNKFFDSIALGTPPILGPHPQAARIVRRFGCGVIARSFAPEDIFSEARLILANQDRDEYAAMIDACTTAQRTWLSWSRQEVKLAAALKNLGLVQESRL